VISPHDHDDYGDWDHDDFVIDALLSAGNSGSPVLAVSCATGEYELVGVFHAGYTSGSALNVVVGIDEVRDLLTTLKRTPHAHHDDVAALDGDARATIEAALGPGGEMFFPFGSQVAAVRAAGGGALLFHLYGKDFPFSAEPALVIEDRPGGAGFGEAVRVWFGAARGLKGYDRSALDGEGLAQMQLGLDALRADAAGHAAYRAASQADSTSRQKAEQLRRTSKSLTRTAAARADLAQSLDDLAERLAPQPPERGLTLAGVLSSVSIASPPAGRPAVSWTGTGRKD
jgi:serine protease Do